MFVYRHTKTGGFYNIIYRGKVQVFGDWHPSVNYRRLPINPREEEDMETIYTRTQKDFDAAFEEIPLSQLDKHI